MQAEEVTNTEIMCNTTRIINKPKDNEYIMHTGTTNHFLKIGARKDKKDPAVDLIEIKKLRKYLKIPGLPNKSKRTCYPRPWLFIIGLH